MNNNLLKLLKSVNKSGDRLVIYNPESPENSWVAISLAEYERLTETQSSPHLTDSEAVDKINQENSLAKESSEFSTPSPEKFYSDQDLPASVNDVLQSKHGWQIPKDIKNSASEIIE